MINHNKYVLKGEENYIVIQMIMEFEKYFEPCEKESTAHIIDGIKNFSNMLENKDSCDNPCLGAVGEFNYYDYLKDKTLNENSLDEKDVYQYINYLFTGIPNWRNPRTMYNVIPPTCDPAIVTTMFVNKYNANMSHDEYSGLIAASELEVVKYIADLVGWNWEKATGVFTFGGKGTVLYALKCALNRACPEGKRKGYKDEYFFISSIKGHPCHAEDANWLGIGSESCVKVGCDSDGKMLISDAKAEIDHNIKLGKKFLGFIATGGSTVELEVDSIEKICKLRDEIKEEYNLNYSPWVHVDSVVGWVWLFFNGYSFEDNPLAIPKNLIAYLKTLNADIAEAKFADSFGVDFHKTGFCPYTASLVMIKSRQDFYNLGDENIQLDIKNLSYGSYATFEQTLELTRSGNGPIGALTTLKLFGIEGYRELLIKLSWATNEFRQTLKKLPYVELLNEQSRGVSTLFFFKPIQFEKLSLEQIIALSANDIEKIRQYNMDYAEFVREQNDLGKAGFILTASDTFPISGTSAYVGMMKAYSLSPLWTEEVCKDIVEKIDYLKTIYDNMDISNLNRLEYTPVDMVYRK